MTVLKLRHRPGEPPQMENIDLVGQRDKLRPEPVLLLGGQRSNGRRELADDLRCSLGAAEMEQPKPGRYQCGGKTTQVTRALSGQNVAQQVIINNDRARLCRCQVGIIDALDECSMLTGSQRVTEELLPRAGREEHHRVAQIDDGYSTALNETPPPTHACWNRYLPALRDQAVLTPPLHDGLVPLHL